jgi:hypothetical protein
VSVVYSITAINARLQGVVTAVGNNGLLKIRQGSTSLSTIQLANPCGTASGGVLTFSGTMVDPAASATGNADNVIVTDAASNTMISGLTVGIPGSGADVIISNGLNTRAITAGQSVQVLAAQITGA